MPRNKFNFKYPKLMSARVDADTYSQFEKLIRYRDAMNLQEVVNLFIDQYVSGNLYVSGSKFHVKDEEQKE